MKKLNLKNLKLNADDMLQRERLKVIFGGEQGYEEPPWVCTNDCFTNFDCDSPTAGLGTCTNVVCNGINYRKCSWD